MPTTEKFKFVTLPDLPVNAKRIYKPKPLSYTHTTDRNFYNSGQLSPDIKALYDPNTLTRKITREEYDKAMKTNYEQVSRTGTGYRSFREQYATGGQLQQQNNAGMNPYLYNSLPQYGLGSWLAENAGTIGTVAGGILGSVIPGAGTALGASIGGSLGGMVTKSHQQGEMNDQQAENVAMQQQQMDIKNATSNYNAQQHPMYGTNFAMGGFMPNVNTWQYSNVGGMNYKCGGQMYSHGGQLGNDNKAAQMTKGLDNVTVYANGGTHEENKYNGIPVGTKGLVEQGEVRYKNYIFSNKF